jgi:hypothetical protein
VPPRQRLQSAERIGHNDQGPCSLKRHSCEAVSGNQRSAGAVTKRVGKEAMTVGLLALQSNKQRARRSAARVRADVVECYTVDCYRRSGDKRCRSTTQFATDFMGNTLKFRRNQMLCAPVCTVYGISLKSWQSGIWKVLCII